MIILVVNCGSSSLKYQVIDMKDETALAVGLVERIGIEGSILTHEKEGIDKVKIQQPMSDHQEAISLVLEAITNEEYGAIAKIEEIDAVGHRIAHGGEKYSASAIINDEVIKSIEEAAEIAPLHNPPALLGIGACQALLPTTPMVAVFDTAFHQTMPDTAYIYALPYELYEKYGIRKYGFHGTSHKYVAERAYDLMGRKKEETKLITCHLGNGASVTAIKNGQSVATSMGFTPLEGIAMGTRSGDVDPALISYIMRKEGLGPKEADHLLNKESGVLGISGVSSDFRDIEKAAEEGNYRADLALRIFSSKVRKYIGAYMADINGVDGLIFTAGVGENAIEMREMICAELENLGIIIDKERNNVRGKEQIISSDDSKVTIMVIPTNEELTIAKDAAELVGNM